MTLYSNDGKIKIYFVPTISNIAAPTVAQLNAGTDLSSFITKDGLTVPADQNNVDVAVLSDTFDAQVVGSFGGAIELTGVRHVADADDDFWNLAAYGLTGYLVIRRGPPTATAWAATQKVEVYPMQFHQPVPAQTGGNTVGQFTVSAPVTSQPEPKATVAA